jgi:hypothetical protein
MLVHLWMVFPLLKKRSAFRKGGVNEECGVRSKKIGGTLEESARGAQRGLLVILATALLWALAMWVGYRFL